MSRPRQSQFCMVLRPDDGDKLADLCEALGKSRAAIVRDFIRQAWDSLTPKRREQLEQLRVARAAMRKA